MPPQQPSPAERRPAGSTQPQTAGPAGEEGIPAHLQRFLIRQPILDAQYRVVGHELALRERVPVPVVPGAQSLQQMRDEMLLTSVIDLAYLQALGKRLTFTAVATDTLLNPVLNELPKDRVVLCLAATELAAATAGVAEAHARGSHSLALDDPAPDVVQAPWLAHFRYARLDLSRYDVPTLIGLVQGLRRVPKLRLVARNVQTEEAFAAARKLGFDLFQGHFFTRLQAGYRHRIDSSRQRILELLNLIMTQADAGALEARFKADAGLTYKLLRLINSSAFGLRDPVKSIGQALMLLGYQPLYRWLTLLLFTQGPADPRAQPLLRQALVRARFAETLGASRLALAQQGEVFLVGILSTLDALFNLPMVQALSQLRLSDAVMAALTRREGPYAPYLELVLACEQFDQERVAHDAALLGASAGEVNLAHVKAMIWAEQLEF